jgi:hypothetical protein
VDYKELLDKCGYSKEIIDIASGKIKVPDFTIQAPFDPSFGFPPALIPLWSNGSWPGYIGLIKHWFGDRPDTYVQFYSDSYSFIEVAKNLDQLKAWLVFDFLCNVPEPDEVGRFAESIGFCKAGDVDNIFAKCEDISGLRNLDVFNANLPAVIEKGEELGEPDWILKPATIEEIRKLIVADQFESAWYKLNSNALDKLEVRDILKSMSAATGDKEQLFKDLIVCWESVNI